MSVRPMSSPLDVLRSRYSVVIVGSGYGGSVVAARLAEDPRAREKWPDGICLLERGQELHPGDYPDRLTNAARHVQVSWDRRRLGSKSALFDFRFGADVNVLVGCGLGGGSLINAGVALRPAASVFTAEWPAAITRRTLNPFYLKARHVLVPRKYPAADRLAKYRALERSAAALGAKVEAAPIDVTFTATETQPACISCGDCVSGCNVGSKNTLLTNYLPMAVEGGVEVFTKTGVREIESRGGKPGGKWLVRVDQPWDRGWRAPSRTILADVVVLAAGTLGSTEILLRSRSLGLEMSSQLGSHFSANGDVLGFAFDGKRRVDAIAGGVGGVRRSVAGPTITGMAWLDWTEDGRSGRVLLEEGTIPTALAPLVPLAFATSALRNGHWRLLKALAGPYRGSLRRTLPYLLIAPDDDRGRLRLGGDRLVVEWQHPDGRPVYRAHRKLLKKAAQEGLGATLYHQPGTEGLYSPLTTVHPLGGCAMADSAETGVVDDRGRVFSGAAGSQVHDGLYVCDGSIIPRPLGVNPLLTIAALAERMATFL